ncbi:MAG: cyclic nucleotide-binding domain-containing protein [Candidatus Omnitrophica bacterium]|nr:cyclic nucleotide-binding domain-containing protein [Candidatus Omnitrophota bacterium]
MGVQSQKQHSAGLRLTSVLVAVMFTVTSVAWASPAPVDASAAPQKNIPITKLSDFTIPAEMGRIESQQLFSDDSNAPATDGGQQKKDGVERLAEGANSLSSSSILHPPSRFVILIQDAHAIDDAQTNIQKLIEHLDKSYGVGLVALEGARSKLDPTIFRAFPDAKIKKQILSGYLGRGELSGAQMAAILGEKERVFSGIEDWDLYEQNYRAYLDAQEVKTVLDAKWKAYKNKLDEARRKIYSEKLNEFQEQAEAFRAERTSFAEFLLYLVNFKKILAQDPELSELSRLVNSVGSVASGDQEKLAPLIKTMAAEFKAKYARKMSPQDEINFYNAFQAFLTARTDPGQFLQKMIETGNAYGFRPKLTPAMQKLLGNTETLASIKGSRLFTELQKGLETIESSLITKSEEKKIADKYRKLFLLRELFSLELTHEALVQFRKDPDTYRDLLEDPEFREGIAASEAFYDFALERDQAFYQNLTRLMHDERQTAAVVVAGGFHTNGLRQILDAQKISYAVVSPQRASLAGAENYAEVMREEVSYSEYLKTTYYDAFVRHATRRLVGAMNQPDFMRGIKEWRDTLIRDLSRKGRITEAGNYTRYLDMLAQVYASKFGKRTAQTNEELLKAIEKELGDFRDKSLGQIWQNFESQLSQFAAGLKDLLGKNQLTPANVVGLLENINKAKPSMLGVPAVLDPSIQRSEVRSPNVSEDKKIMGGKAYLVSKPVVVPYGKKGRFDKKKGQPDGKKLHYDRSKEGRKTQKAIDKALVQHALKQRSEMREGEVPVAGQEEGEVLGSLPVGAGSEKTAALDSSTKEKFEATAKTSFFDVLDEYWEENNGEKGGGRWGGEKGFSNYLIKKWGVTSSERLSQIFKNRISRQAIARWRTDEDGSSVKPETVEVFLELFPNPTEAQIERLRKLAREDRSRTLKQRIAEQSPFFNVLDEYWEQNKGEEGGGSWDGENGFIAYLLGEWKELGVGGSETLSQVFDGRIGRTTIRRWIEGLKGSPVKPGSVEDFLEIFPHTKVQEGRLWRLASGDRSKTLDQIIYEAEERIAKLPIRKSREMAAPIFSKLFNELHNWSGRSNSNVSENLDLSHLGSNTIVGKYKSGSMPDHLYKVAEIADLFVYQDASLARRVNLLMLGLLKEKTPGDLLAEVRDSDNPMTIHDMFYVTRLQNGHNLNNLPESVSVMDNKPVDPLRYQRFETGSYVGDIKVARAMADYMGFTATGEERNEVIDRIMDRHYAYDSSILQNVDFTSARSRSQALIQFEKSRKLPVEDVILKKLGIGWEHYWEIRNSGVIKSRSRSAKGMTDEDLVERFIELYRIPDEDQDRFWLFAEDITSGGENPEGSESARIPRRVVLFNGTSYYPRTLTDPDKIQKLLLAGGDRFKNLSKFDHKEWARIIEREKNGDPDGAMVIVKPLGQGIAGVGYYGKKLRDNLLFENGEIRLDHSAKKPVYSLKLLDVANTGKEEALIRLIVSEVARQSLNDPSIPESLRGAVVVENTHLSKSALGEERALSVLNKIGLKPATFEIATGLFSSSTGYTKDLMIGPDQARELLQTGSVPIAENVPPSPSKQIGDTSSLDQSSRSEMREQLKAERDKILGKARERMGMFSTDGLSQDAKDYRLFVEDLAREYGIPVSHEPAPHRESMRVALTALLHMLKEMLRNLREGTGRKGALSELWQYLFILIFQTMPPATMTLFERGGRYLKIQYFERTVIYPSAFPSVFLMFFSLLGFPASLYLIVMTALVTAGALLGLRFYFSKQESLGHEVSHVLQHVLIAVSNRSLGNMTDMEASLSYAHERAQGFVDGQGIGNNAPTYEQFRRIVTDVLESMEENLSRSEVRQPAEDSVAGEAMALGNAVEFKLLTGAMEGRDAAQKVGERVRDALNGPRVMRLDIRDFKGTTRGDYDGHWNDLDAFSKHLAKALSDRHVQSPVDLEGGEESERREDLQTALKLSLLNAWIHGNALRSTLPIFIGFHENENGPYISIYTAVDPDVETYKKTEVYRKKFQASAIGGGAELHGRGSAEKWMEKSAWWTYERRPYEDAKGQKYIELRISPRSKNGKIRSEVRFQIPQDAIPQAVVAVQGDLSVVDAKLLDLNAVQRDQMASVLFVLEKERFKLNYEDIVAGGMSDKAAWDNYLKSPGEYIFLLMNTSGEIVGAAKGSRVARSDNAKLDILMSKARGGGTLLLDSFLSQMYRSGAPRIEWTSSIDALSFYNAYIKSRKPQYPLSELIYGWLVKWVLRPLAQEFYKKSVKFREPREEKEGFLTVDSFSIRSFTFKVRVTADPLDPKFDALLEAGSRTAKEKSRRSEMRLTSSNREMNSEEENGNEAAGEKQIKPISYAWQQLFKKYQIPLDGTVVEVAPGYETKIGDGLTLLGFHGTIFLIEPDPSAAAHVEEAYQRAMPGATIKIIAKPLGAVEIGKDIAQPVNFLTANHPFDDMVLASALNGAQPSFFSEEKENTVNLTPSEENFYKSISDSDYIHGILSVTASWQQFIQQLKPDYFIANQYPSRKLLRKGLLKRQNSGFIVLEMLRDTYKEHLQVLRENEDRLSGYQWKPSWWVVTFKPYVDLAQDLAQQPEAISRLGKEIFVSQPARRLTPDEYDVVYADLNYFQSAGYGNHAAREQARHFAIVLDSEHPQPGVEIWADRQKDKTDIALSGNQGSGRAGYYGKKFNIIGVGKTSLATSPKESHSNGHHELTAALRRVVISQWINRVTNRALQHPVVLARKKTALFDRYAYPQPLALLVRVDEQGLDRPSHVEALPGIPVDFERTLKEYAELDAEFFAYRFMMGAWSTGNYSLDGRMIDLDTASFVKYRGPYRTVSAKYQHNLYGYERYGFLNVLRQLAEVKGVSGIDIETRFDQIRRDHLAQCFLKLLGADKDRLTKFLAKYGTDVIELADRFEKLSKKISPKQTSLNLYEPIPEDEDPALLDMSRLFRNLAELDLLSSGKEEKAFEWLVRKSALAQIRPDAKYEPGLVKDGEVNQGEVFIKENAVVTYEELQDFLLQTKDFVRDLFQLLKQLHSEQMLPSQDYWKARLEVMNQDFPTLGELTEKLKFWVEEYRSGRIDAETLGMEIEKLSQLPDYPTRQSFNVNDIPLFNHLKLTDDKRQALVAYLKAVDYSRGQAIFREREDADSLFILAQGTCKVIMGGHETGKISNRGTLIGEEVFSQKIRKRNATVVADTPVQLLRISREDLRNIFVECPGLNQPLPFFLDTGFSDNRSEMRQDKGPAAGIWSRVLRSQWGQKLIGEFNEEQKEIIRSSAHELTELLLAKESAEQKRQFAENMIASTKPFTPLRVLFSKKVLVTTSILSVLAFLFGNVSLPVNTEPMARMFKAFGAVFKTFAFAYPILWGGILQFFVGGWAPSRGEVFVSPSLREAEFKDTTFHEMTHHLMRHGKIKYDLPFASAVGILARKMYEDSVRVSSDYFGGSPMGRGFGTGVELTRKYSEAQKRWPVLLKESGYFWLSKTKDFRKAFSKGRVWESGESYILGSALAGMAYELARTQWSGSADAWEYLARLAKGEDPIAVENELTQRALDQKSRSEVRPFEDAVEFKILSGVSNRDRVPAVFEEALKNGKAVKLDFSELAGSEVSDYDGHREDMEDFVEHVAVFLSAGYWKNMMDAGDPAERGRKLQRLRFTLRESLFNAWAHGNALRSELPIYFVFGDAETDPHVSIYNEVMPDREEYKGSEEYKKKFAHSADAGIRGGGVGAAMMEKGPWLISERIDHKDTNGEYTEARISLGELSVRSEVRVGGLTLVDPGDMVTGIETEGVEAAVRGIREQGRAEFRKITDAYNKDLGVFLENIRKNSDIFALMVAPEFEKLIQEKFADVAQFLDLESLYGRLLSATAPEAFAGETEFVDAGRRLDSVKIAMERALLAEAIRNAKAPRIVLLMDRPAQDQDAEDVLRMIGQLPLEQLIVLHGRDQVLGTAFRTAAQGRLTPVAVKGPDGMAAMAQKIARSRDAQIMVSFWTRDFGAGELGIYSVLAEIAQISDPDLRSLALQAVHYAILKFASLDEATRKAIASDPAKIKEYLGQTIPALAFFKFGKNGLELVIDQFVNNYLAEQSISQSA